MTDWQPISTYDQCLWDSPVVLFKDAAGNEKRGRWSYEDESWDPETGEEWVWGAYHDESGDSLGFDPAFWKPVDDL